MRVPGSRRRPPSTCDPYYRTDVRFATPDQEFLPRTPTASAACRERHRSSHHRHGDEPDPPTTCVKRRAPRADTEVLIPTRSAPTTDDELPHVHPTDHVHVRRPHRGERPRRSDARSARRCRGHHRVDQAPPRREADARSPHVERRRHEAAGRRADIRSHRRRRRAVARTVRVDRAPVGRIGSAVARRVLCPGDCTGDRDAPGDRQARGRGAPGRDRTTRRPTAAAASGRSPSIPTRRCSSSCTPRSRTVASTGISAPCR